MSAPIRLNPAEEKVLSWLAIGNDQDFGYQNFRTLCRWTRLKRPVVRRACRSLARKGLAVFARGLWTEDGEPAGSGYCSTAAGRARAKPLWVARNEARRWP